MSEGVIKVVVAGNGAVDLELVEERHEMRAASNGRFDGWREYIWGDEGR
jgi:hypothetical protein